MYNSSLSICTWMPGFAVIMIVTVFPLTSPRSGKITCPFSDICNKLRTMNILSGHKQLNLLWIVSYCWQAIVRAHFINACLCMKLRVYAHTQTRADRIRISICQNHDREE